MVAGVSVDGDREWGGHPVSYWQAAPRKTDVTDVLSVAHVDLHRDDLRPVHPEDQTAILAAHCESSLG